MRCARCNGDSQVVDSRPTAQNTIMRRRKCVACGHRFKTFESTVNQSQLVEQRRAALRAFKARMSPEERAAFNKRDHLRRGARKEARETGVPVAEIYRKWGVE